MRTVTLGILLLSLVVLAACQDDAARMEEHMARGEAYVEQERYREAVIEFKSALQIEPNHAPAHYSLAHAYFRSGKAREGFWELRETVRLDPANSDAKLEFSQLAILAGEKDEALKQATSVVEAEPDNVQGHLVLGQALDSLDRRDEALASYAKAVEVDPENETAMRGYARALFQRKQREEAEKIFVRLIEIHPNLENYTLFARFLRGEGREDEQERYYKKAVELADEARRQTAISALASFYVLSKRKPQAFELLEREIQKDQPKIHLIYLLARLYRGDGDIEKADELIESTADASPHLPQVHRVLASYRARNGDYDGALEAAERALELDPDDQEARLQKAEILMELGFKQDREGAVDEASAIVAAVLAAEPSNAEALFANAKLQLGKGEVGEAVSTLRSALENRPDWADAHYLLGVALAVLQDYSAARTELAQALESDAGLLDAKNVLAQVHFRLSEWQYCVERGRQYLKEKPEANGTRLLVAQSLVRLGQVGEAQAELDRIPAEERDGEVLYALGRIRQNEGDAEGAREYLLAANEAMPNSFDILQALLAIDRAEGKLPESVARIQAALEADSENARLYQLAGVVALMERKPEEAEAHFKKAIEVDAEDLTGYERLARFYARTGRLDETARIYEQALEVRPEEAQLHHFLGVLYELAGERERAIESYEEAIRYGPELSEAKNNLAYMYAESGENLDRALDLAQDAKQKLPDSPSVADTLGWVLYKRGVPSAAISYLKEAEASTAANDESLGVVRFHLAQAYQADGKTQEALNALDRSLDALNGQMQAIRERGGEPGPEPEWAVEARALREELAQARTAGT